MAKRDKTIAFELKINVKLKTTDLPFHDEIDIEEDYDFGKEKFIEAINEALNKHQSELLDAFSCSDIGDDPEVDLIGAYMDYKIK